MVRVVTFKNFLKKILMDIFVSREIAIGNLIHIVLINGKTFIIGVKLLHDENYRRIIVSYEPSREGILPKGALPVFPKFKKMIISGNVVKITQRQNMNVEYEATFLNIQNTQLTHWLSIYNQGDGVALRLKVLNDKTNHDKEIYFEIHNRDSRVQLLNTVGYDQKLEQETKRASWKFDDTEITIDEPPFLRSLR
jgi:hypothetical protein